MTHGQGGTEEIHEDIGFLSRDADRGSSVFRQFLSEAFVTTYDVSTKSGGGPRILFDQRESESAGGMGARMHLSFTTAAEYELVLELAPPGPEVAPCQPMKMKRAH